MCSQKLTDETLDNILLNVFKQMLLHLENYIGIGIDICAVMFFVIEGAVQYIKNSYSTL